MQQQMCLCLDPHDPTKPAPYCAAAHMITHTGLPVECPTLVSMRSRQEESAKRQMMKHPRDEDDTSHLV